MAAVVAIERGGEASYVDALSYTPAMPVAVAGQYLYVGFLKMMLGVSRMLHNG